MRTFTLICFVFLLNLNGATGESIALELLPGLEVTEYPRHRQQSDDTRVFLEPENLGKPISKILFRPEN